METRLPITTDCHVDLCWVQTKIGRFDLTENNEGRYSDIDLPRMKLGGLQSAVFALYLSEQMQDQYGPDESLNLICRQIAYLETQAGMTLVDDPEIALDCVSIGMTPIFLGLEGGRLLNNDLTLLEKLRNQGVRYLTVTHNKNTDWADSATDVTKHHGLTPFGRRVVIEANRVGILMDVSHGSWDTTNDILIESTLPVIASHSGAQRLVDHPRNLTDDHIRRIAETKGVIHIPFAKRFVKTWKGVADHIDHVVQTVGYATNVGIGSDLDGAELADGIQDVSDWTRVVIDELALRGYPDTAIANISGGNTLRVLGAGLGVGV